MGEVYIYTVEFTITLADIVEWGKGITLYMHVADAVEWGKYTVEIN